MISPSRAVKISMLPWLLSYQPITKELSVYERGRCYCQLFQNGFKLSRLSATLIYSWREKTTNTPGRFLSVTDSDVDKLTEDEENTNTNRKTLIFRPKTNHSGRKTPGQKLQEEVTIPVGTEMFNSSSISDHISS